MTYSEWVAEFFGTDGIPAGYGIQVWQAFIAVYGEQA